MICEFLMQEDARWADLIVTAGGDGTFLMAAGRVLNRNKPVVGKYDAEI